MVERIYPVNVSYMFDDTLYIKYDNKSGYKNLSKDDKENIRTKVMELIKSDIDRLHDNLYPDEKDRARFSFEILDDIEIK